MANTDTVYGLARLGLSLLSQFLIVIASVGYAIRRRSMPAVLLAVGALGALLSTFGTFLGLAAFDPWVAQLSVLLFAAALLLVLRQESGSPSRQPTEQAFPAEGAEQ